jgi:hypothetical protein
VGRAWSNGGLSNSDWIKAANTYVPANHKGANFSSAIVVGLPNSVGTVVETNMVTTADGQYQVFVTPSVGAVSPQVSFGLAQGYIEGNFDTPSQFSGIALQAAGGINLPIFPIGASADIWMGLDGESNPSDVWGWDVSGSVGVGSPGLSGSIVVANAIPVGTAIEGTFTSTGWIDNPIVSWFANYFKKNDHGKLNGPQLLLCRANSQCGRSKDGPVPE